MVHVKTITEFISGWNIPDVSICYSLGLNASHQTLLGLNVGKKITVSVRKSIWKQKQEYDAIKMNHRELVKVSYGNNGAEILFSISMISIN